MVLGGSSEFLHNSQLSSNTAEKVTKIYSHFQPGSNAAMWSSLPRHDKEEDSQRENLDARLCGLQRPSHKEEANYI